METILAIGATGETGRTKIRQLQGQNFRIIALVDDIEAGRRILGENVDLVAIRSPETLAGVGSGSGSGSEALPEAIALRSLTFQPHFDGEKIEVVVWDDRTIAIDQGDDAGCWFSEILGFPCRLVRQSPDEIRPVDPEYAGNSETPVSFADGYPILLANTASLADLNDRLAEKIPMARFRPNIVFESDEPFIEGTWKTIRVGDLTYSLVKPCSRCLVTTTDQETGERDPNMEPLKTLATFRRFGNEVMFGENVIPRDTGFIQVGDRLDILEAVEPSPIGGNI